MSCMEEDQCVDDRILVNWHHEWVRYYTIVSLLKKIFCFNMQAVAVDITKLQIQGFSQYLTLLLRWPLCGYTNSSPGNDPGLDGT
jgi:hypothetical protein